ncbi:uncharacterized protein LOC124165041 [Ischnura elegans]|uniref:uncharacterized protein LOC124165041 n=1 Tax=Ischnura elegans TaxID=197161 RepID=UPI001ED89E08|nr:uncharacterized protein LOC124165041 [Ischnura elegans]
MPQFMEKFVLGVDDWQSYEERLEEYFIVLDLGSEEAQLSKKRAILLSSIGKDAYNVVRNLCAPKKPAECTYSEITGKLTKYFNPDRSVIAERHRFNQRVQLAGENVHQFAAGLRESSRYCKFGGFLDEALRDQFVLGLSDKAIVRALYLEDETLAFEKAIELAYAREKATENVSASAAGNSGQGVHFVQRDAAIDDDFQEDGEEADVHRVKGQDMRQARRTRPSATPSRGSSQGERCYCCGHTGHRRAACRFRAFRCDICRKVGHLKAMCKEGNVKFCDVLDSNEGKMPVYELPCVRDVSEGRCQGDKREPRGNVKVIKNYVIKKDWDLPLYNVISSTEEVNGGPWFARVVVDARVVKMEIDTGSAISAISEEYYRANYSYLKLKATSVRLRSYSNTLIQPLGTIDVSATYKGHTARLSLFVVTNGGPPLLGRDWFRALKFPSPVHKINMEGGINIQGIWDRFRELWDGTLGSFKGSEATLHLKPGTKPVFCSPRALAFALRDKVDRELDRLLELGILYPVDFSDWATPIVPIVKGDGNIRICGDFKITVNPQLLVERYPLPRVEELFSKLQGGQMFSTIDLSQAFQQMV